MAALLDRAALLGFASHIVQLRERLARRYGQYQPSAAELAFGLFVDMEQSDQLRLRTTTATRLLPTSPSSPPDHQQPYIRKPSVSDLKRYLRVADAAYATTEEELSVNVRRLSRTIPNFDGGEGVLKCRMTSTTYYPAYFVMFEHFTETLIICVRGSLETADMITDLSAQTISFLSAGGGGRGNRDDIRAHRGIGESAKNLLDEIYPFVIKEVAKRCRTESIRGGIVITGHSLGGATATALTLLLKRPPSHSTPPSSSSSSSSSSPPRTPRPPAIEDDELVQVMDCFHRSHCYAFGPPPFLHKHTGLDIITRDVTTIINGWDFIPRCSVTSVNRLVDRCARIDYSPTLQGFAESATEGIAQWIMPREHARSLARSVSGFAANADGMAVSTAVRGLSSVGGRGGGAGTSTGALILSAVTDLFASTVEQSVRRHRSVQQSEGRRRRQGVDRAVYEGSGERGRRRGSENRGEDADADADEDEDDMVLVGDIWHVDRRFTKPEQTPAGANGTAMGDLQPRGRGRGAGRGRGRGGGRDSSRSRSSQSIGGNDDDDGDDGEEEEDERRLPRSRLVGRAASFFRDIEMCTWMKYDHFSHNMLAALERVRE